MKPCTLRKKKHASIVNGHTLLTKFWHLSRWAKRRTLMTLWPPGPPRSRPKKSGFLRSFAIFKFASWLIGDWFWFILIHSHSIFWHAAAQSDIRQNSRLRQLIGRFRTNLQDAIIKEAASRRLPEMRWDAVEMTLAGQAPGDQLGLKLLRCDLTRSSKNSRRKWATPWDSSLNQYRDW